MDEGQEKQEAPGFIDIPEIFYSDLTNAPMQDCVNCHRNLLETGEPYIIEKAFRKYADFDITNTIFEYIMCMPCAREMHESMSKESIQRIESYFQNIDLADRSQKMKKDHGYDINAWLSECIVNGSSRENLEEYQICAQCMGDQMVFDMLPYMMSHEASDHITSLLSAQTLDEYNRFVDDNFGLPPEFKKALKDHPVLIG